MSPGDTLEGEMLGPRTSTKLLTFLCGFPGAFSILLSKKLCSLELNNYCPVAG